MFDITVVVQQSVPALQFSNLHTDAFIFVILTK